MFSFAADLNNCVEIKEAKASLEKNRSAYGEYKYQVMLVVLGSASNHYRETINSILAFLKSDIDDFEFLRRVSDTLDENSGGFYDAVRRVVDCQLTQLNKNTANAYAAIGMLSAIFSVSVNFHRSGAQASKNLWSIAKMTAATSVGIYAAGFLLRRLHPDLYAPIVRIGQTIDAPRVWMVSERLVGGTFRLIVNQAERLSRWLPESKPAVIEKNHHLSVVLASQ
jgi:hypothetical protein